MNNIENQILIIFGASGDLSKRKLIPALLQLQNQKLLPEKFAILGIGRTDWDDSMFREKMSEAIKTYTDSDSKETNVTEFLSKLFYQRLDTSNKEEYTQLKTKLNTLSSSIGIKQNYIFYLSTPPSLYPIIPKHISAQGLNDQTNGFKRVIIEKPFGYDLKSAKDLNKQLLEDYEENQIYRIDHYLGKETVQNILVTRFSNTIFEALWNRNYIHHVEITSAESIGVGDRGGYYDGSGALRDMIQNHLMQLVGLVAMEPPASFDSNAIRNETLKVFQSLKPIKEEDVEKISIRGQYVKSEIRGEQKKGYREESGVAADSKTETYAAIKFYIDNWRWGGVPFYIRSGKALPTRVTEIVIHFNTTPHSFMGAFQTTKENANRLIIRIQPDEGILLKFGMKVPGQGFEAQTVNMDFHYSELTNGQISDSYERLLLDSMQGDSTLYTRGDAVEELWKFIDPIQKAWKENDKIKIYGYPTGTWGPENADDLIEDKDLTWRYPCKNLSDDGIYCEL